MNLDDLLSTLEAVKELGNHSSRFWMHLRQYEQRADLLHENMRDAWKSVPIWAQRGFAVEF